MGWFKKILISLYIGYLLLVFISPFYFIHHCLSEQQTEIVVNLGQGLTEQCHFCSHPDLTKNHIEKPEMEEHSCCEQSRKSGKFEQETFPQNTVIHKSHNGLTSQCCSYSVINLDIDYFSLEKIKEINPLNFLVIYLNLRELVDNPTEPLYLELPRQVRLPSKEFLSKLLSTIYFTSLVG